MDLIWGHISPDTGIKIPVPPFDQFKKHHFGSTDMCGVNLGIELNKLQNKTKCMALK